MSAYDDRDPPMMPPFVAATGLTGLHTGRRRWRVWCSRCSVEVHEATTGPASQARYHEREAHR